MTAWQVKCSGPPWQTIASSQNKCWTSPSHINKAMNGWFRAQIAVFLFFQRRWEPFQIMSKLIICHLFARGDSIVLEGGGGTHSTRDGKQTAPWQPYSITGIFLMEKMKNRVRSCWTSSREKSIIYVGWKPCVSDYSHLTCNQLCAHKYVLSDQFWSHTGQSSPQMSKGTHVKKMSLRGDIFGPSHISRLSTCVCSQSVNWIEWNAIYPDLKPQVGTESRRHLASN